MAQRDKTLFRFKHWGGGRQMVKREAPAKIRGKARAQAPLDFVFGGEGLRGSLSSLLTEKADRRSIRGWG